MNYLKHFNLRATPQTQPIPFKNMEENNAGGFSFKITPMQRLVRFLVLGSEGGTYYTSEQELTVDNAKSIVELVKTNGTEVVDTIVEVSESGRAPKNEAAIFALALAVSFGNEKTKQDGYSAISRVCRTGTHLFSFMEAVKAMRGFSRGLRRGIAYFYTLRNADEVAHQLVKYRQRGGWTHKDVLRLSHPKPNDVQMDSAFQFALGKEDADYNSFPEIIKGFVKLQNYQDVQDAVNIIHTYKLPREAVPTELLQNKQVWEALLPHMPIIALVRNLGKMTSLGMFDTNLSINSKYVLSKLADEIAIRKSKIHPLAVLVAMKTYSQGKGDKGKLTWTPNQAIVGALDSAFYLAFGNATVTGKNIMLGLDVSGSMGMSNIANTNITAREATAALALVMARTEPYVDMLAFSTQLIPVAFHAKATLSGAIRDMASLPFGGTDCSLPIEHALKHKIYVDTFVILTDSETYAGRRHPVQTLAEYRKVVNPKAQLVVVGMTATEFTVADPTDSGMLDVVGFDTATPEILASFIKGEF